jgi:hypothetical protein
VDKAAGIGDAGLTMQSKAGTVAEYLQELPADRRAVLAKVRSLLKKNLPKGLVELMGYGMICYSVPHSIYPPGYRCDPKTPLPFASLAAQKNYYALYLMTIYGSEELEAWLRAEYKARGLRLDMGKGCLRFKRLEDLPLDVIAELAGRVTLEEYIRRYDAQIASRKK